MKAHVERSELKVDPLLADFIEGEALPGTPVTADRFWSGLAGLVADFMPGNRKLLAIRERLQSEIDGWHRLQGLVAADPAGYESFFRQIGKCIGSLQHSSMGAHSRTQSQKNQ